MKGSRHQRFLVGRSYLDAGLLCLAPVTLLCLVIGFGLVVVGGHWEGLPGIVLGGVLAFLFVRQLRAIGRSRMWVTDGDDGFWVESPDGDYRFADTDVVGYASWERVSYRGGKPVATKRSATLLTRSGDRFDLSYRFKREDPLAPLLARLEQAVEARAVEEFEQGKPFIGDGWRYGPDGLVVETGDKRAVIPSEKISKAEMADRHLCVWTGADIEPVLRVPDSGLNVSLLADALSEHVIPNDVPVVGLGRHLFTRDLGWARWKVVGAVVFAACLVVGGIATLVLGEDTAVMVVGGVMLLAALILAGAAVANFKKQITCYTNGVTVTSGSDGEDTVAFDDLSWFTYSAVRRYVEGSYVGTRCDLVLQPAEGSKVSIGYSTTTRDAGLDEVRDRVAAHLAARWCQGLAKGREQIWLGGTAFTPGGMRLAKGRVVPYPEFAHLSLDEGTFSIDDPDGEPLISGRTSDPNFYAGLEAMKRMGARFH